MIFLYDLPTEIQNGNKSYNAACDPLIPIPLILHSHYQASLFTCQMMLSILSHIAHFCLGAPINTLTVIWTEPLPYFTHISLCFISIVTRPSFLCNFNTTQQSSMSITSPIVTQTQNNTMVVHVAMHLQSCSNDPIHAFNPEQMQGNLDLV